MLEVDHQKRKMQNMDAVNTNILAHVQGHHQLSIVYRPCPKARLCVIVKLVIVVVL